MKTILKLFAIFILTLTIGGCVVLTVSPQFGASAKGDRMERIRLSQNYNGKTFVNPIKTSVGTDFSSMISSAIDWFRGGQEREPSQPLPTVTPAWQAIGQATADEVVITWLGHSTVLIEIGGYTLLTDPVLSGYASPFRFMGPKDFPGTSILAIDDIPQIDAVIISHDHYDHLDYETIVGLRDRPVTFFVPLGVGAHLEHWGVPSERIVEKDWGGKHNIWQLDPDRDPGPSLFRAGNDRPQQHIVGLVGDCGRDSHRVLWRGFGLF